MSVPIDVTDDTLASSLVPVQCASLAPPAVTMFKTTKQGLEFQTMAKELEVFHLFRCSTHTHLLRTIFANSDVECILRAKTLQLHLTGMGR